MAMDFPNDLRYTDTHEYLRATSDRLTVGVTAFAVDQLGDIVFVELPAVGRTVAPGEVVVTIESVKAVGEVYAPVVGTIVAVNEALGDTPETLADDPYTAGWLIQMVPAAPPDWSAFLDAETYRQQVGA
ncbi:MAG: glycine cleavage system protein GcvH [Oscillatoriales cyanobacterium SM2_1_8]|nr:glycine cleavage system protein GcvH [Oscillatoriales cyanobacterium SM2_1_8]